MNEFLKRVKLAVKWRQKIVGRFSERHEERLESRFASVDKELNRLYDQLMKTAEDCDELFDHIMAKEEELSFLLTKMTEI